MLIRSLRDHPSGPVAAFAFFRLNVFNLQVNGSSCMLGTGGIDCRKEEVTGSQCESSTLSV